MKNLESIEVVDISGGWSGFGLLRTFPNFNGGIHCKWMEYEFEAIEIKTNVNRCCLSYVNRLYIQQILIDFLTCFPNLHELCLNLTNGTGLSFKSIMLYIVSRLQHLKHVYLKFKTNIELLENDILDLHAVRKIFNQELNAAPIIIHLNKDEVEIGQIIMPEDSLISIQLDCDVTCKLCAAGGNGFSISEYMIERLNEH